MDLVWRVLQVGIVGLTAAMTLVAGIPRYDCICPDGSLKLFCPGCVPKENACCCSGSERPELPKAECCQPVKKLGCCGKTAKESGGREKVQTPKPSEKPKAVGAVSQQRGA